MEPDKSTENIAKSSLETLFSSPALATLRYALVSLGTLLALFGVVALSPQQIDHIISIAQQLGTTAGAFVTLIGLTLPPLMTLIGALRSTDKAKIIDASSIRGVEPIKINASAPQSIAALAVDPNQPNVAPALGQEVAVQQVAKATP